MSSDSIGWKPFLKILQANEEYINKIVNMSQEDFKNLESILQKNNLEPNPVIKKVGLEFIPFFKNNDLLIKIIIKTVIIQ